VLNSIFLDSSFAITEVKLIVSSIDENGPLMDMSGSHKKALDDSRSRSIRSKKNDLDASEPLANGGFDINKGDYDKRTPLHLASSEGHYDVVECLIKHGANVNVEDRWGGKPLVSARYLNILVLFFNHYTSQYCYVVG